MAKLTWLGEDGPEGPGPSYTTAFGGIKFPKGEAVEVSEKDIVARARKNKFFEVSGSPGRPPKVNELDPPADPPAA